MFKHCEKGKLKDSKNRRPKVPNNGENVGCCASSHKKWKLKNGALVIFHFHGPWARKGTQETSLSYRGFRAPAWPMAGVKTDLKLCVMSQIQWHVFNKNFLWKRKANTCVIITITYHLCCCHCCYYYHYYQNVDCIWVKSSQCVHSSKWNTTV